MPELSPGPKFDPLQNKRTTREDLVSLLSRTSEQEHGLACACLFAAYSLKNDTCEGRLTDTQANMVRGWRRSLGALALHRMRNLAQILNLLTAIGGTPYLIRPSFPMLALADSSGTGLSLEPFSLLTSERLETYVRLDALYDTIATGLHTLPAEELFIGPPEAQANPRFLNLDDQLVVVVDQASADAALAMIVGTAEGKAAPPDSGADIFSTIRREYAAAMADAQQTGVSFEPVRSVGKNPRTRLSEEIVNSTHLIEPLTVATADLFNDAYDTMVLLLSRFFTHTEENNADLERLARAALRLMNSVIRPLGEALMRMPADNTSLPGIFAGPPFGDSGDMPELVHRAVAWALFDERLWQLAIAATKLCTTPGLPIEIKEATAALQDLTCQFAPKDGPHGVAARIATLKEMQANLDCAIESSVNGPYVVTNVDNLVTWLGERIPARPQMALCRCGSSAIKPFCDGTHARIDFTGQKDPKRVPDRRETYAGTAVTIFDNRGICAHSGFCTDRLASAFHVGQEPFVSPNGARMDDIIRAVRACPSGALSYTIGDTEVRKAVDQERPPTIEVSKDGPYRITGSISLKDGQGNAEARNTGASLEHYSLCRCGHSQNKPFCSGMHWYVNFHDPMMAEDHEPSLFEWVGGLPVLTRMTHLFYDKYVPQEPLLRPLFADMSPDHPERVAAWLGEVFGGPKAYSGHYGSYPRMLSQHIGKGITEAQRMRWASLLSQAADEAGLPADAEFRSAFASYIEWGSRLAVENSTPGAHPPPHMPMPRWDWGTAGPPGSRISALAPVADEEVEVALPTADELVRFDQHIKPLFRQMDRLAMQWAFDLWSYKDVVEHADGILKHLQNGSMPCDSAWPHEKVETFQRWIESGMQE